MEFLRDPVWGGIAVLVAVLLAVLGWVCRWVWQWWSKRRDEKQRVRNLLTFLWDRRVLQKPYSLIDTLHPVQSAESVREIRIRLRDALAQFPDESKAAQSIRDMHGACLKCLDTFESLPIPKETGELPLFAWSALPDELVSADPLAEWLPGGRYSNRFHDAAMRMREVFETRIDELYKEYGIERLPPHEVSGYVKPPE